MPKEPVTPTELLMLLRKWVILIISQPVCGGILVDLISS